MKISKIVWLILLLFIVEISSAQKYSWFFIRAKSNSFQPQFKNSDNHLVYIGTNSKLKAIFSKYKVYEFKKTFRNASKKNLKKTFFVVSDDENLMKDLLNETRNIFEFGELIREEDKKIFEPNDYGLTATIGDSKGMKVNLDYLDFLEVPKAWYYTTGTTDIKIGISDAYVDTTSIEFKNKATLFKKSSLSKGHGSAVASIAAAQGDNEFGIPGVCYDCDIYTTSYGDFKNLKQLIELSKAGVKVINCSWASTAHYETAQIAIDEIFENGTIIVAGAGNRDWSKTKGQTLYYPASYNHVISVSAGMYKYKNYSDNVLQSKGKPYVANIRGFVGRTAGFKNGDISTEPYIYSVSITTLNTEVDILSPSTGVLLFNKYLLENKIVYDANEHTSNATPFVSGTIGLMFSLNPCLPIDEVETIIKLTALNIDKVKANKPYYGYYGAGMLAVGNAVKMVYDLYAEGETATIENQNFNRWNFKLTSYSEKVLIQNQKFTESSTLNLTAKNSIVIGENTVLKPNSEGSIILKIDPTLEKECDLVLREGFPNNKYYHPEK